MRDEPAGAALLDAARQALLGEVAPTITGRQRYVALMVANALGIAAREIEAASRAAALEAALLSDGSAPSLVGAIRSGARDADPVLYRGLTELNAVAAAIFRPEKPA